MPMIWVDAGNGEFKQVDSGTYYQSVVDQHPGLYPAGTTGDQAYKSGVDTAAAQAAAHKSNGLGGLLGLGLAGAGLYFGMPGLSSLFSGAGAALGDVAGAEGLGGLFGGVGSGTALTGDALGLGAAGAAAGATGAANMGDWWTQLGLSPQDVGVDASAWSTNPSMGDLTGGVLNNAGSASMWSQLPPDVLQAVSKVANSGTSGSSLLQKLFSGNAQTSDYAQAAGLGLGALLPYLAGQKQAGQLQSLAQQNMNFGAPSRARFEQSMTPGFDPMSIPGYAGALDSTSKSVLARLSASGGNPFGNPGGLIDANKQIVSGTALPAIQNYQNTNLNAGYGAGFGASNQASMAGINANAGSLTGVAGALGQATTPNMDPNSLAALLKTLGGSGGTQTNTGINPNFWLA